MVYIFTAVIKIYRLCGTAYSLFYFIYLFFIFRSYSFQIPKSNFYPGFSDGQSLTDPRKLKKHGKKKKYILEESEEVILFTVKSGLESNV